MSIEHAPAEGAPVLEAIEYERRRLFAAYIMASYDHGTVRDSVSRKVLDEAWDAYALFSAKHPDPEAGTIVGPYAPVRLWRCGDCLTLYALDRDVDGDDARCQRVEAGPTGVRGICGGKYERVNA